MKETAWILVLPHLQRLYFFKNDALRKIYPVSTAKKGLGELQGSYCTPRGWHQVHSVIGEDCPLNSVFVGRVWTKEIYSEALAAQHPDRDWILSRIIRLEGLEPGFNQGGEVDSFKRYIYLHGTPEPMELNRPLSHGCIRMRNKDIKQLADWLMPGVKVYICEGSKR